MNLVETILELGAHGAGEVAVKDITFRPEFRKICEGNGCGMFGKSWMCPPTVGKIEDLIAQAQTYHTAYVYQIVESLEDSYDIEGMLEAGKHMNQLTQRVRQHLAASVTAPYLVLGAGGCRVCEKCAKREEQPCRFPDRALASLEAYGVDVTALAPQAGLKYNNGRNTVTFFGAVFL